MSSSHSSRQLLITSTTITLIHGLTTPNSRPVKVCLAPHPRRHGFPVVVRRVARQHDPPVRDRVVGPVQLTRSLDASPRRVYVVWVVFRDLHLVVSKQTGGGSIAGGRGRAERFRGRHAPARRRRPRHGRQRVVPFVVLQTVPRRRDFRHPGVSMADVAPVLRHKAASTDHGLQPVKRVVLRAAQRTGVLPFMATREPFPVPEAVFAFGEPSLFVNRRSVLHRAVLHVPRATRAHRAVEDGVLFVHRGGDWERLTRSIHQICCCNTQPENTPTSVT
mmetsp:Transcript_8339/g.31181  ORF Transcript_8339/g.31181 Transcript_8339/m.31181 type:complete len:276 (+) Transcript_8339:1182-2009(+)